MNARLHELARRIGALGLPVIGVTGHKDVYESRELSRAIRAAIDDLVSATRKPGTDEHLLMSSLAPGSDQLVALEWVRNGTGQLVALLPYAIEQYRKEMVTQADAERFKFLIGRARETLTLPYASAASEAYLALGSVLARHSDGLVAIWDGRMAKGPGGTGHVIEMAQRLGKPVAWIDIRNGLEVKTLGPLGPGVR